MEFRYVIASLKSPAKGQEQAFLDALKQDAHNKDNTVQLKGMIIDNGPGCVNYGLLVEAPNEQEADKLAGDINFILQPSKWANASPDDRLTTGVFKDFR